MNNSLWPVDLVQPPKRTPLVILREQASALGPMTNQLVTGEVEPQRSHGGISLRFFLIVPTLDDYHYLLFDVWHGLEDTVYPLTVRFPGGFKERQPQNEEQFREVLLEIFSSDRTRGIVSNLVAHAQQA